MRAAIIINAAVMRGSLKFKFVTMMNSRYAQHGLGYQTFRFCQTTLLKILLPNIMLRGTLRSCPCADNLLVVTSNCVYQSLVATVRRRECIVSDPFYLDINTGPNSNPDQVYSERRPTHA